MIHSASDTGHAAEGQHDRAMPVAAAVMTATFALAALGGAAIAGLQSLFGA